MEAQPLNPVAEDTANAEWERLLLFKAIEEALESVRREGTIPHEVVQAKADRMRAELRARRDAALCKAAVPDAGGAA